jgi:hypothetical protein
VNHFNAFIPGKRSMVLVNRPPEPGGKHGERLPDLSSHGASGQLRTVAFSSMWTTIAEPAVTVNDREPESLWCLPLNIPRELPSGLRERD